MKFGDNMYLGNITKTIEFKCHRSKVKITRPHFLILYHCEIQLGSARLLRQLAVNFTASLAFSRLKYRL